MTKLRALWLNKRFTDNDFRAVLKNILLKEHVARGQKRPNNLTQFIDTRSGDLIRPQDVIQFIKALNKEVDARNKFYRGNNEIQALTPISFNNIVTNTIIQATPFTNIQRLLTHMLGDNITNFSSQIPHLFSLLRNNEKTLILTCEQYFARLEFVVSNVSNTADGVRVEYSQVQNWHSEGRSSIPFGYDSLANLIRLAPTGKVKVGIADTTTKDITWFNNITLKNSTFTSSREPNTANVNKSVQKQIIRGYFDLTIDQDFENYMTTQLQGTIIEAHRFNKFKEFLNRAEIACLCDCNYCTCDCNYCTCDCNYCTCNCNYCTCDCNYCTCNCNYCTCNNNREYTDVIKVNYGTVCSCNLNKKFLGNNIYGQPMYACPQNSEFMKSCACNLNKKFLGNNIYGQPMYACPTNADLGDRTLATNSTKTQVCSCNVDKQWTRMITGKPIWDKRSTGQVDNRIDDNSTKYSKGITKQVCICDTNVTIFNSCPANKNYHYTSVSCNMNSNPNFAANNYVCFCNINVQKAVKCPANREYTTVTDYNLFQNTPQHRR